MPDIYITYKTRREHGLFTILILGRLLFERAEIIGRFVIVTHGSTGSQSGPEAAKRARVMWKKQWTHEIEMDGTVKWK